MKITNEAFSKLFESFDMVLGVVEEIRLTDRQLQTIERANELFLEFQKMIGYTEHQSNECDHNV